MHAVAYLIAARRSGKHGSARRALMYISLVPRFLRVDSRVGIAYTDGNVTAVMLQHTLSKEVSLLPWSTNIGPAGYKYAGNKWSRACQEVWRREQDYGLSAVSDRLDKV